MVAILWLVFTYRIALLAAVFLLGLLGGYLVSATCPFVSAHYHTANVFRYICKPSFARSRINVHGQLGVGMAQQCLRLLDRRSRFNNQRSVGNAQSVEVKLALLGMFGDFGLSKILGEGFRWVFLDVEKGIRTGIHGVR
jgi:hypothetical protein